MILATLCYIHHDGSTLMLHRIKRPDDIHAGKWNGLGGKFVPGESPEECVIREVREESGLDIKNPRLRGLLMFPGFKDNGLVRVRLHHAEIQRGTKRERRGLPEVDPRYGPGVSATLAQRPYLLSLAARGKVLFSQVPL